MPYYDNLQYGSRAVLSEQGWPVYLFGSRDSNLSQSYLSSVAITSNVATVGIQAWSGPFPAAGDIVTIRQSQTNSGAFNVSNLPITAVTLDAAGNGTIQFALTHADVATTPDAGNVRIVKAVVGEAIAAGASMPATIERCNEGWNANIFCDVQFPTIPTAVTVKLQTAMRNIDSDFKDAGTVATVVAGAVTQSQANIQTTAPFYRFSISGLTGTGTIAALGTT